jgi:hypothetical protein
MTCTLIGKALSLLLHPMACHSLYVSWPAKTQVAMSNEHCSGVLVAGKLRGAPAAWKTS